ncbi:MAG: DNA methyltransferase [Blastocatellia bacterium]
MIPKQLLIPGWEPPNRKNGQVNRLDPQDRMFHDWYRFVLSFPPHLVRGYCKDFGLNEQHTLLDPFCGTGTTLVEARLQGISAYGIEANPFAHFASTVKTDWCVCPNELLVSSRQIANEAKDHLAVQGIDDQKPFSGAIAVQSLRTLSAEEIKLLLTDSISPIPLHKALILLECIKKQQQQSVYQHQLLALAKALVFKIGNLHFGPEIGVGKAKVDSPVISAWLCEVEKMAEDLRQASQTNSTISKIHLGDARRVNEYLPPNSVDAVITSPPYPNEKDYTRITRLESVLLGFISNKADLRSLKNDLVRSNTRNVYKDDDDDRWVAEFPAVQTIAQTIEQRRIELGKTSGFEKLYGRVARLYFGGMARHLAALRTVLRPGAQLAYVVGDQASYLRVMIRTGQLLAEIAESLGYELVRIDLFRTRLSTTTKEQLREEVVILRWRG